MEPQAELSLDRIELRERTTDLRGTEKFLPHVG